MSNNVVGNGESNNNVLLLLALAKNKYGTLNEAERKFFSGVAKGESVDFSSAPENDNENNNPANAKDWGEERIIKTGRIAWLCTDQKASTLVTYKGIELWQARIDGKLDLSFSRIPFPLRFIACAIPEKIMLLHTNIHSLYLNGSHTGSIWAHGLKVEGHVRLCDNFTAEGPIYLISAMIGGNLEFDSAKLKGTKAERENKNLDNEKKKSDEKDIASKVLDADGLEVKGSLFLRNGFNATGEVRLVGAKIGGNLECDGSRFINGGKKAIIADGLTVKGNVFFHNDFTAEGEVSLTAATIGGNLDCSGGRFINKRKRKIALNADSLRVEGDVCLRGGFKSEGLVDLTGATIGSNFDCRGGKFFNKRAQTISANSANIKGSVFLNGDFNSEGWVNMDAATIGGALDCSGGQFTNRGAQALSANSAKIEGNVFLNKRFNAEGWINLDAAIIGGGLNCRKGQFINKGAQTLSANSANVKGSVFLNGGFKSEGEVNLVGATIGGGLDCEKGQFINEGETAISAGGVKIGGNIYLCNCFKSEGKVRLYGATIGGSLDCRSGQFINKDSEALIADGLNVNGSIFLNEGFKAEGQVRLYGATVRVNLDCIKGRFTNKNAEALIADMLDVKCGVFLCGFKAEGKVSLTGATIGGALDCSDGQFIYPDGIALMANSLHVKNNALFVNFIAKGEFSLVDAEINGFFYWMDIASTKKVRLDLRSAKIGTLRDEVESWPEKGKLSLHGLLYNEIHDKAPRGAEERIDWLQRQYDDKAKKDKDQFRPQPYEQLAVVFRRGGQGEDAREILITKNKDKARLTKLTWSEWIWYRIFGHTIGYGYRPLRALWGVLIFIVLGWIFFGFGYWGGLITPDSDSAYVKEDKGNEEDKGDKGTEKPSDKRELSEVYPRFNFIVYSVDTFVPLINLRQGKYWLPNAKRGCELFNIYGIVIRTGGLLRLYLWIHILMGWLLSTLCVGGLTRLVRT